MEDIIEFIRSLGKEERRVITSHLKNLSGNRPPYSKEFQLFKSIVSGNEGSHKSTNLARACGYAQVDSRLNKIKFRLFRKCFEALTLDHLLENQGVFKGFDGLNIRLKKKMLQYRILRRLPGKVNVKILSRMLNEIIRDSQKNELYDVLTEALQFKKQLLGVRQGKTVADQISVELKLAQSKLQKLHEANDIYLELSMNFEFRSKFSKEQLAQFITLAAEKLKNYYQETSSLRIGYYYKRIEIANLQQKDLLSKASDACLELISLLRDNPIIYRKERMGIAYDNFSSNLILAGEYKKAWIAALKAQEFYPTNSINALLSMELQFRSSFYNQNYSECLSILSIMFKHREIDFGEFRSDKFTFYQACVYFRLKNYSVAKSKLERVLELAKDKGRWDLSIRTLRILIHIELGNTDLASSYVEAMRKCIERVQHSKKVSPRDILIYKLFYQLDKSNFRLDIENNKLIGIIDLLRSRDPKYRWNPLSNELIPIHLWTQDFFQCLTESINANKARPFIKKTITRSRSRKH